MTRTRNRRRRANRPMKQARNYWFWYTGQVLAYETMMRAFAHRALYR
jgi:hypothetical protein